MKMSSIAITLGLIALTLLACLFTVFESDRALVLRFKKLQVDSAGEPIIYEPGLHFKVPFIDEVRKSDMRLNILDIKASRINTQEKKDVIVDYYVSWKIENLALFYKRTQGLRARAEALLGQRANAALKIEFGKLKIAEVVSGERMELMDRLRKLADEGTENLGLRIIDVRIKRIELPSSVKNSVYRRMQAERNRIANEFRAAGEKEAISIRAEADKEKRLILAEAKKQAEFLRGEGDAEAAGIFVDAYSKSADFFEYYKTLETYRESFNTKNDILVLKPEGRFFKYFTKE